MPVFVKLTNLARRQPYLALSSSFILFDMYLNLNRTHFISFSNPEIKTFTRPFVALPPRPLSSTSSFSWNRVCLCSSGCPRICPLDQAGLPQPPDCWDSRCAPPPLLGFTWTFKLSEILSYHCGLQRLNLDPILQDKTTAGRRQNSSWKKTPPHPTPSLLGSFNAAVHCVLHRPLVSNLFDDFFKKNFSHY